MAYSIGDVVHWALDTTSGEGNFIGYSKSDRSVLLLATAGIVEIEISAVDCGPTGRSEPALGSSTDCATRGSLRAS